MLTSIPGFIFIQKTDKTRSFGLNAEYDTHRVSGRGTYGTVFKALHRAEGKWYAVKMFSTQSIVRMGQAAYEGSFTAGEIPEALKREIEIMRSINHPHICQFKEVFYAKDNISKSLVSFFCEVSVMKLRQVSYSNGWMAEIFCHIFSIVQITQFVGHDLCHLAVSDTWTYSGTSCPIHDLSDLRCTCCKPILTVHMSALSHLSSTCTTGGLRIVI